MKRLITLLACSIALLTGIAVAEETKGDSTAAVSVPSGPPLAEGEVIILLQAKVPLEVIQQFVSARGVNFVSTKEASKKILAAGGNVALIGTVNLNQREDLALEDGKKKK